MLKLPDNLFKVGLVADVAVLEGLGHIHVVAALVGVEAQPGVGPVSLPRGPLPGVEGQGGIALRLQNGGQGGGGPQHILLVGDAARGQEGHGVAGEELELAGAGARAEHRGKEAYKNGAKAFLGVELADDEMLVRVLKDNISDADILQLAFSSNIGRESSIGEKALSNLALYKQNIASLPPHIASNDVAELSSQVASILDKQSHGLNSFDTNLALLSHLARNGKTSDILSALDNIKGSPEQKNKIIKMYVENAGNFYNLAHNTSLKSLDVRDYLSEAIYYGAKADISRESDYARLIDEIEGFKNLSEQGKQSALSLDEHKIHNLTAQSLGLALAKFQRQENPSAALYDCQMLKTAAEKIVCSFLSAAV